MKRVHFEPDAGLYCRKGFSIPRGWLVTTEIERVTCAKCKAARLAELRFIDSIEASEDAHRDELRRKAALRGRGARTVPPENRHPWVGP